MFINWGVTARFDPHALTLSTHGIPIPTYGNYGGPNYTAGVEGGTTPPTANPPPVNDLDALFYAHDYVYQQVQDGSLPPSAIAPADVNLIEQMQKLTVSEPALFSDPETLTYEGLATISIVGKILSTPSELAYLEAHPSDLFQVTMAANAGMQNFETGLAELPGNEARSLNGAFHALEAHQPGPPDAELVVLLGAGHQHHGDLLLA